jgi:sugar phosphate isomerase/epimerase
VLGGPRQRGMAATHAETAVDALASAAAHARGRGVRLAIENHGDITAAELFTLIQRVNDEHLGVCFDTANALRVGDDVEQAAKLLAADVLVVHLKDIEDPANESSTIAGPCSVPYGRGVVPLEPTLTALQDGGFDGLVCIEVGQLAPAEDERVLVRSGLDWLAAVVRPS